jgi:sugar transferase (PEP-CTERM/EpsH1 system associated)
MRILIITPQVPYPPRQGTSIRNYHLIAHLARRHQVDLLTFLAPGDELTPDSPLYTHCGYVEAVPQPQRSTPRRLVDLATTLRPDMALRLESAAMHAQVQSRLAAQEYDVVQIEGIELAQYARHVDRRRTAVVFDDHNCEYLLQQRNALTDLRAPRRWHAGAYSLVQWAKLRRYEAAICRTVDGVVAVSEPDRDALVRIAPGALIRVAPNGIDLANYAADKPPAASIARPFCLLFTGKMDYRPNVDAMLWFADEVLPLIHAAVPEVKLQIVGMNPHPRLARLRSHAAIEITGTVPDPRPYFAAADAYIIPMRVGGGTRFKALEAMASSKPIVSTSLGVEGIGVQPERELLIGDTPEAFALAVFRLITDQATGATLARQLGKAARAFVAEHYTWDYIMPTFEELYRELTTARSSSSS